MWKELLVGLNAAGLASIDAHKNDDIEYLGLKPFIASFPDSALGKLASRVGHEKVHWLGQQGATPDQIIAAEERLGVTFPESYRDFLLESNGFLIPSTYCCVLLPVELVRKFADENGEIVTMWADENAKQSCLDEEDFTCRIGEAIQASAEPADFDWFVLFDPIEVSPKGEPWTIMYSRQGYQCSKTFVDLIQELANAYRPNPEA